MSGVAIVTGAGSGIGREIAVQMAAAGYRVALCGRRIDALRETGAMLRGPAWTAIGADVGDPAQAQRLIDECVAWGGRLDALVNNAGLAPAAAIEDHTPALIREVFDVNAVGVAASIARAWPVFQKQGGGCIVNVSSMATIDPYPTLFAYAAAKASVNVMARVCALAGRPWNIRAFAVAPGAVETAMLRGVIGEQDLPTSRTLAPAHVAGVIVACAKGERDAENGQTILLPSP